MQKIEVQNLCFSYQKQVIIKNINLILNKGELVCLCGPNGVGKSTLLKAIYDSHLIKDKDSNPYKKLARTISFLPQKEDSLWNYSVFDTVLSGRFCHTDILNRYCKEDFLKTQNVLNDFELTDLSDKSITRLSGGEYQKVRLARAFNQETDFLLLDEPLTGLDFSYCEQFMNFLKEKSQTKGILICLHDLNLASRFADRIFLCGNFNPDSNENTFLCGRPDKILTQQNIKTVYKIPDNQKVQIFTHPVYNCPQVCI